MAWAKKRLNEDKQRQNMTDTTAFSLQDKVFIVTGANSGIGKEAARQLAQRSATVIMACRSADRGQVARDEIAETAGNSQVDLMLVDMASQASIHAFAETFRAKYSRLDGLINNAAHFDISQTEPVIRDGIESIFATNHLGPFTLTLRLLDELKSSAPARILNVSSQGLMTYPNIAIQYDDLTTSRTRAYKPAYAYYHSKLAHVMFTLALARRLTGTGVTANTIRVPNVRVDVSRYPDLPPLMLKMYDLKQRFAITAAEMAETYVRLIADKAFEAANAEYYDEKCRVVKLPRFACQEAEQERLWEITAELVGLKAEA